jgi:hypothetical protein
MGAEGELAGYVVMQPTTYPFTSDRIPGLAGILQCFRPQRLIGGLTGEFHG